MDQAPYHLDQVRRNAVLVRLRRYVPTEAGVCWRPMWVPLMRVPLTCIPWSKRLRLHQKVQIWKLPDLRPGLPAVWSILRIAGTWIEKGT